MTAVTSAEFNAFAQEFKFCFDAWMLMCDRHNVARPDGWRETEAMIGEMVRRTAPKPAAYYSKTLNRNVTIPEE